MALLIFQVSWFSTSGKVVSETEHSLVLEAVPEVVKETVYA